jgi:hypothetical protein
LNPEQKSRDPNTPADDLLFFAPFYPDDVLSNPILPLIALEKPELWHQIVDAAYEAKDARKYVVRYNLERQQMTLRFLLEILAWLVGILLFIIVMSA